MKEAAAWTELLLAKSAPLLLPLILMFLVLTGWTTIKVRQDVERSLEEVRYSTRALDDVRSHLVTVEKRLERYEILTERVSTLQEVIERQSTQLAVLEHRLLELEESK